MPDKFSSAKLAYRSGAWRLECLPEGEKKAGMWLDSNLHVFLLAKKEPCSYNLYISGCISEETILSKVDSEANEMHSMNILRILFEYNNQKAVLDVPMGKPELHEAPRLHIAGKADDTLTDFEEGN